MKDDPRVFLSADEAEAAHQRRWDKVHRRTTITAVVAVLIDCLVFGWLVRYSRTDPGAWWLPYLFALTGAGLAMAGVNFLYGRHVEREARERWRRQ